MRNLSQHLFAVIVYLSFVIVIMHPLLAAPGNIFLTDMVFPEHISFSSLIADGLTPGLPIMLVLYVVSAALSVAVAQKIFLFLTLFAIPMGVYMLLSRRVPGSLAIAGGAIALFNPFVYERFMIGQWFVLLGYAYLPYLLFALERFRTNPGGRHFLMFSCVYACYPLVSLHFAYLATLLLLAYLFLGIIRRRSLRLSFWKMVSYAIQLSVIVFVVNFFWLITFFSPHGAYAQIDAHDFIAYATQSDPTVGAIGNVLLLYGFWHEGVILPKDLIGYWWLPVAIIGIFALVGIARELKRGSTLAYTFTALFVPIVAIAVGFANSYTEHVARFLIDHLPGFRGLRDTAKFVGLIAFVYAYYAPIACAKMFEERKVMRLIAALLLILLAYASAFTLANAGIGQVVPHQYPKSWNKVDVLLAHDPLRKEVLVVPWRGYLVVDWAGEWMIANPAGSYFSFPVLVDKGTDNAELSGKEESPLERTVSELLDIPGKRKDAIAYLRAQGITHIIELKTSNWERYHEVLNDTTYFQELTSYPEIAVYRLR